MAEHSFISRGGSSAFGSCKYPSRLGGLCERDQDEHILSMIAIVWCGVCVWFARCEHRKRGSPIGIFARAIHSGCLHTFFARPAQRPRTFSSPFTPITPTYVDCQQLWRNTRHTHTSENMHLHRLDAVQSNCSRNIV